MPPVFEGVEHNLKGTHVRIDVVLRHRGFELNKGGKITTRRRGDELGMTQVKL